ncbi:hypothetical protein [Bremerella sp.]|uniref:hypothetical protein n=1 Tax=Bremerella sp. TaxID=2795602 RepID=UPI00391B828B
MELEFKPHDGTDQLPFGTSRGEIRDGHLAGKRCVTRRSIPSDDMYPKDGLKLGYDSAEELEFIEVFPPATCQYSGIQLVGSSTKRVLAELEKLGHTTEYDDDSYNFAGLGIILYCPDKKVESASIYKQGYYD